MKFLKTVTVLTGVAFTLWYTLLGAETVTTGKQSNQGSEKEITAPAPSEEMKTGVYNTRAQTKAAIRDLAGRLKVALNEVKTVRVENVTWPDGSLGCPQKGMSYTQAEVPGVLIVLSAKGAEHEYHAGNGNTPVYCDNPSPQVDSAI